MSPSSIRHPVNEYRFGPAFIKICGVLNRRDNRWKIDREDQNSFGNIAKVAYDMGISHVFAPIPSDANALIETPCGFIDSFGIGGVKFWQGCRADGMIIPKGAAMMITSADCATDVIYDVQNPARLIAMHAGRQSVLGKELLPDTIKSHSRVNGVIDNAIELLTSLGTKPEDITMGVFGGIRTNLRHDPNHPQHWRFNQSLIRFCSSIDGALLDEGTGEIDMYRVIEGIARLRGVENILFDEVDTGSLENQRRRKWASHRFRREGDPHIRNLNLTYHSPHR